MANLEMRYMNFQHERCFNINTLVAILTVVREGSVSRAAALMNLPPPAVSHQINRLGEDTNVTLVERTPTGLRIPPKIQR